MTDDTWITTRIAEAQAQHPSVTQAAASRLERLLAGEFGEQPLAKKELTAMATALVADMAPDHSGGHA